MNTWPPHRPHGGDESAASDEPDLTQTAPSDGFGASQPADPVFDDSSGLADLGDRTNAAESTWSTPDWPTTAPAYASSASPWSRPAPAATAGVAAGAAAEASTWPDPAMDETQVYTPPPT